MDPQNIYDDAAFFEGYAELRRTESGLNAVLEQPAMMRLLPPSMSGLRVLDLGCGFGNFSRLARAGGAREVVGLDVSVRMLAEAAKRTDDPAITYARCPIEQLGPEHGTFDLVCSSLALHYVSDYQDALRRIAAATVAGGQLLFSVEHPMWTSRAEQAWHRAADGTIMHWPVDQYHQEGERRTKWFVDGVVKYHRTVSTYLNGVTNAGFAIRQIDEPCPAAEDIAKQPRLDAFRRCPNFLLVSAARV
jgi:ubiquinone/menaquinone biosynthesis C-methylase UbiE